MRHEQELRPFDPTGGRYISDTISLNTHSLMNLVPDIKHVYWLTPYQARLATQIRARQGMARQVS